MRILSFTMGGEDRLGVRRGDDIVDLAAAAPDLPRDLKSFLEGGDGALARAKSAADGAAASALVSEDRISYLPLVDHADKYLCIGLNYVDHARETGNPIPDYPIVFVRTRNTLVAHLDAMQRPKASDRLDYEAELAAVIGTPTGLGVAKDRALDHVAGYTCFNDGSLRDFQRMSSQFTLGKCGDRTGGFGPDLVTADELPAGGAGLAIKCHLNGKTLQDSNTDQLIFDVPTLIHEITKVISLVPGDVIITGTGPGVGAARTPPVFMFGGDVCEVEIEGIGTLRNPIVDEA